MVPTNFLINFPYKLVKNYQDKRILLIQKSILKKISNNYKVANSSLINNFTMRKSKCDIITFSNL